MPTSSEVARKAALKTVSKMTKEQRSEIAKKAWKTRKEQEKRKAAALGNYGKWRE